MNQTKGSPFKLQLAPGKYKSNQWINTKTGVGKKIPAITASDNHLSSFTPPDTTTDWVMLIRKEWKQKILSDATIISAKTDPSGSKILVKCSRAMNNPAGSENAFKIKVSGADTIYPINKISLDPNNNKLLIIELNNPIGLGNIISLSYSGSIQATDRIVLSPITDLTII